MKPNNIIVKVAGLTYLIIIVIGVLHSVFIDTRLIILEDINLTISNIVANEFLFRFGLVSILILYIIVIILSVSLYLILKSVNKNLALLAMVFRIGEALLGVTTVYFGFGILGLLHGQFNMLPIENAQLTVMVGALLDAQSSGLYMVLMLVGIGGTIFLYLFYRSSSIPVIISAWGIFTYISMIILSFLSILLPALPDIVEIVLFGSGTLFELTIGFWLLIKGVDFHQLSSNGIDDNN